MRKMYADVGYREPTHVTIVKPYRKAQDVVIFREIGPFESFDDTVENLIRLMVEWDVEWDDFYCPHFPAVKLAIMQRLGGRT